MTEREETLNIEVVNSSEMRYYFTILTAKTAFRESTDKNAGTYHILP